MKSARSLVALSMVLASLVACNTRSHTRFAIYVIPRGADMHTANFVGGPLLTEYDIRDYDWATHTISLAPSGENRLFDYKKDTRAFVGPDQTPPSILREMDFVVVVDGERCYRGAFWWKIYSQSSSEPVIDIYSRRPAIQIERAFPSPEFGVGPDPRPDPRVKRVLEELKRIRNAS